MHVILHQATECCPNRSTHCGNMMSYLFLKMAAATAKYYFRFRICWCHCLQKAKVYQQTKFRRDISIGGWDITTSGFEIQTFAILEFYFRFRSRPVLHNLHVILYQATEFRPNRSTHGGNMTSYPFLKMAAATAKFYFRFPICWCRCSLPSEGQSLSANQISSRYFNWRLKYNYFQFRNTNVRHIGILLSFRSRPVRLNLHVILYQAVEFRPNRSTHSGNMTSYPFLKMAAATAKYYFRLPICWCRCLQKIKVYQQTKFRPDISIGGWDITTFGFEIQTSAILEFYFRFRSRPVRRNLHVILYQAVEFRPNRSTHCGNMTS